MLDEGSTTNPTPVFVADGRRRHNGVRLLGATLGLLLAGWLAALATGIVGFAPLPALPLPSSGPSDTAPATHPDPVVARAPAGPSGTARPVIERQSQAVHQSGSAAPRAESSPGGSHGAATGTGTSGSSGSGSTASTGGSGGGSAAPPSGTGSTTAPPSGTGTGTTPPPPSGTGGGSQSNSGSEPAWTPPETGTKGADPPRGNSSSAPGSTISASVPGQGNKPSG